MATPNPNKLTLTVAFLLMLSPSLEANHFEEKPSMRETTTARYRIETVKGVYVQDGIKYPFTVEIKRQRELTLIWEGNGKSYNIKYDKKYSDTLRCGKCDAYIGYDAERDFWVTVVHEYNEDRDGREFSIVRYSQSRTKPKDI